MTCARSQQLTGSLGKKEGHRHGLESQACRNPSPFASYISLFFLPDFPATSARPPPCHEQGTAGHTSRIACTKGTLPPESLGPANITLGTLSTGSCAPIPLEEHVGFAWDPQCTGPSVERGAGQHPTGTLGLYPHQQGQGGGYPSNKGLTGILSECPATSKRSGGTLL